MVKGMSATETIVALALGLIVIVGLGYLVWTWLGRGGGTVDEQFCRAQLLTYCARNSKASLNDFFGKTPKCDIHKPAITENDVITTCQQVLGTSG